MIAEILIIVATVWVVIGLMWHGVFYALLGKDDPDWSKMKLLLASTVFWPIAIGIFLYTRSKRKNK